jgi:hypothetical protein
MPTNFLRVTSDRPCPICGKPDWCLREKTGAAAICQRVESPNRIQRPGKDSAGWLHKLDDRDDHRDRPIGHTIKIEKPAPVVDFSEFAAECSNKITDNQVATLASSLGVSASSLRRLGIGWSAGHRAFAFPMKNGSGTITGIRLRSPRGAKYAVKGSRQGLFYDRLEGSGRLLITEGPTDCAAALDMGYAAIGRPSCNGCADMIRWLVCGGTGYPAIVICADADEPGQRGAAALARDLALVHRDVWIFTPPAKDLRAWYRPGIDTNDVISPKYSRRITTRIKASV